MGIEDDNIDVVSSPASAQDVTVSDQETSAQPSSATDEKPEPASVLDIVRDVTRKTEEAPASSAEPAADQGVAPEPADHKAPEETRGPVPYARFQEVVHKSRQYQERAAKYDGIENFLQATGITEAEAADTLQLLALMKANPAQAWEKFRPIAEDLARRAGVVLDASLEERVGRGELPRDAALELSKAQARAAAYEAQRIYEQQTQERIRAQQHEMQLAETLSAWKADRELKDPNFAAKQEAISMRLMWIERQQGFPKTVDDLKKVLNEAYAYANQQFAPAPAPRSAPKPVQPVRGGQTAGNNSAPPTILDIVKRVGRGQ